MAASSTLQTAVVMWICPCHLKMLHVFAIHIGRISESYTDLYGGHLKWLTLPFLPWSRLIMGTFIKSFSTYPHGLIKIDQDFHWNLGLPSAGRNSNKILRRSCRPYIHAIMFRGSKKSYTPLWDTLVSTKR